MPDLTLSLLADLQLNNFPVTAVREWQGSYLVDFADDSTDEQQEATWEFVRNWQPPALPNWGDFRLALLTNVAYQRTTIAVSTNTAGILLISRLENAAAMAEPPIAVIIMLWNSMISRVPLEAPISLEETEQWQAIALAASVPLQFSNSGLLSPL